MLTEPSLMPQAATAAAAAAREARARRPDASARPHPALAHFARIHAQRQQPAPQGIDLGLLMRRLWQRLPLIVGLAAIGAALGFAAQRAVKPRYTSSVSVLLEPKQSSSFGADTMFGSMEVDAAKIDSVVSVITSSDMLDRVVGAEHLDEVPGYADATPSMLRTWLGLLPFMHPPAVDNSADARFDRAMMHLERSLHVDRVGFTYVLNIEAVAGSPELARRIASAVASAYLSDQVERKVAATQHDSAWLTERLSSVRKDLERSEAAVDVVRRQYGLLETDLGSGATLDRQAVTDLNGRLIQAQAEVANQRVRYEQVEHPRGGRLDQLPEAATSPLIQELRSRQGEDAKQIAALRAVYGDNYPALRRLEDGRATLQAQIDAEIARLADSRRVEYEAAVAREQAVREQLQRAVSSDGGVTGDEGHERLRDAQRLVAANRGLYDSLLTKWQDVQQQQTREEPEARVISQASLPDRPSFPKPFILPAGGGAVLAFLGIAATLLPVLFEKRFIGADAVEQKLGIPVLGAIPLMRRRDLGRRRGKRSIVDFPNQRPLSRFAESLRMVRAFLRISPDGAPTILQVTSAIPGEGKSTVAATLAVSAASAGVRTVLIDADLRSSSVSEMFGLRHAEGLSDILETGIAPRFVVHQREEMTLSVLGSGASPLPRPDLLDSIQFEALLRELSESYSLIILDTPPVLRVSDPLVLSRHADATILVVQWRATPRKLAEQAVRLLRGVSAPLAGVMLNKIDVSKIAQHDYGYPDDAEPAAARRASGRISAPGPIQPSAGASASRLSREPRNAA